MVGTKKGRMRIEVLKRRKKQSKFGRGRESFFRRKSNVEGERESKRATENQRGHKRTEEGER